MEQLLKFAGLAFFTAIVAIRLIETYRFAKQGEIYLLYSNSGDGLLGLAYRDEEPVRFWLTVLANVLILLGLWFGALFVALRTLSLTWSGAHLWLLSILSPQATIRP